MSKQSMRYPSKDQAPVRIRLVAIMAAFTLFLSTIEYLIPKPVPFMRIGLANLPLMIALGLFTYKEYAFLVLLKFLGQQLVTGTIFSYVAVFSFGGTLASALTMFVLYHGLKQHVGMVGIAIAGAMASNIVQLILSRFILFGESAWLIAPPFLTMGLVTALLLGLFANTFIKTSKWYQSRSVS